MSAVFHADMCHWHSILLDALEEHAYGENKESSVSTSTAERQTIVLVEPNTDEPMSSIQSGKLFVVCLINIIVVDGDSCLNERRAFICLCQLINFATIK